MLDEQVLSYSKFNKQTQTQKSKLKVDTNLDDVEMYSLEDGALTPTR